MPKKQFEGLTPHQIKHVIRKRVHEGLKVKKAKPVKSCLVSRSFKPSDKPVIKIRKKKDL